MQTDSWYRRTEKMTRFLPLLPNSASATPEYVERPVALDSYTSRREFQEVRSDSRRVAERASDRGSCAYDHGSDRHPGPTFPFSRCTNAPIAERSVKGTEGDIVWGRDCEGRAWTLCPCRNRWDGNLRCLRCLRVS